MDIVKNEQEHVSSKTEQGRVRTALIFVFFALLIMLTLFLAINTAHAADNIRKVALLKDNMPPLHTEFLDRQMYTPVIALTFDDGPNKKTTLQLIEALDERGAKATFFVLGDAAKKHPEIVKTAFDSGHQIANHSYDHPPFTELKAKELKYQVNTTIDIIYQITGETPAYVRPPYGRINRSLPEKIGWPLMLWTVDPRDWECQDADIVYKRIMSHASNGAVIVLHDKYPSTLEAVKRVIDELQPQGWQFVTIDEYYQYFEMEPQPHKIYRGTEIL